PTRLLKGHNLSPAIKLPRVNSPNLPSKPTDQKEFKEKLQEYEAKRLIDESSLRDNRIKIINKVFEEKNFQEVRGLVQKIINLDDSVVVLAGIKSKGEGEGAKILFACSRVLEYDMNGLIREAGKFIEGRGGGAPNFSQAGGKRAEGIEDALNFALEHFQEFIQK
ncbi:unnamed protein product, partial [marine sediment metagenome]